MGKSKTHLTINDRIRIQIQLGEGKNFKEIGAGIGKDSTTISREIKSHMQIIHKPVTRFSNDCKNRGNKNCPVSYACDLGSTCRRETCSNCPNGICGKNCSSYSKLRCEKLDKPPYVCNGCKSYKIKQCQLEKQMYVAAEAQKTYKDLLSTSRQGIHIDEVELKTIENILENGIVKKHQSINHVFSYAQNSFPVNQRTVYKYINDGIFPNVKRIDQPKAVRFKPKRLKKSYDKKVDRSYLIGRTYSDYIIFSEEIDSHTLVELDSVEGKKGGNGRVLLTLTFIDFNLQLYYVLEAKTQENVIACLSALRESLGDKDYASLFSVLLTDRGTEFQNADGIEKVGRDTLISKVFYCDAMRSTQKPHCERNHAELRRIIPKGTEIRFNQEKATLITNHIASMPRPRNGNRSAYEVFCFYYGEEVAKKLGLRLIPSQDINLSPSLLS